MRRGNIRQVTGLLLVGLLLFSLFLWGCGTQKNNASYRFYHKWTAYFNYYFNAKEAYEAGEQKAAKNMRYDYTRPLPFCIAGLPEAANEASGDMDRVIEKCTDLIRLHSLTVKPKRSEQRMSAKDRAFYAQNEFNKYARKAWLLIGKARVWTREFDQAEQALDFAMRQFVGQSEGWEAQLWMARLDMLRGDTLEARNRLAALEKSRLRPTSSRATYLLEGSWADLLVRQGRYKEALRHGQKALTASHRGDERTRARMAMAKLYEINGDNVQALALFKQVNRAANNYEMRFNALLSAAALTAKVGGKSMDRQLQRMEKDEKNAEYLDQIFYALANIAMSKGDTAAAIDLYKQSASASMSNAKQKGISFLRVAEYYNSKKEYLPAAAFYDSALAVLPETYPNYEAMSRASRSLSALANAHQIVTREDSLQRVAAMPEKERNRLINERIGQVLEEERQEQARLQKQQADRQFAAQNQFRNNTVQPTQPTGGQFYFYNTAVMGFGRSDFKLKWGDRKLEDDWRRLEKSPSGMLAEGDNTGDGSQNAVQDKRSPQYYLQDLPLNDSLMRKSKARVARALQQEAEILRSEIQDYRAAIEVYKEMARRDPDGEDDAYYLAYLSAVEGGYTSEAEDLRKIIIRDYPESNYAKMLTDPTFVDRARQQHEVWEEQYEKARIALLNGERERAFRLADAGLEESEGNDIARGFALLKALSTGQQAGDAANVEALKTFAQANASTSEGEYATDVLMAIERRSLLGEQSFKLSVGGDSLSQPSPQELGSFAPSNGEQWIILLAPTKSDLNMLRFRALGFQVDYDVNLNLDISEDKLNDQTAIVLMKSFENRELAAKFLKSMRESEIFAQEPKPLMLFISPQNYELLLEQKTFAPYLEFFRQNYGS